MAKHKESTIPKPWILCGEKRGGCDCRQIWDGEGMFRVAVALRAEDDTYTNGEGYTFEAAKVHAKQIVSAFNNTYAKGINPEAVGEVVKVLEDVEVWLECDGSTDEEVYGRVRAALAKVKG